MNVCRGYIGSSTDFINLNRSLPDYNYSSLSSACTVNVFIGAEL